MDTMNDRLKVAEKLAASSACTLTSPREAASRDWRKRISGLPDPAPAALYPRGGILFLYRTGRQRGRNEPAASKGSERHEARHRDRGNHEARGDRDPHGLPG